MGGRPRCCGFYVKRATRPSNARQIARRIAMLCFSISACTCFLPETHGVVEGFHCLYEMQASVASQLEDAKGQTHPNSKWGTNLPEGTVERLSHQFDVLCTFASTPNLSAIFAQESSSARREAILERSMNTLGRPIRFPRARAASRPERTRERISSRSNSAMEAKIPKTNLPFGVKVSTPRAS